MESAYLYDATIIHKFREIKEESVHHGIRVQSYNLLHNFENPFDRELVSRTALRRYAISRVPVKRSHQ